MEEEKTKVLTREIVNKKVSIMVGIVIVFYTLARTCRKVMLILFQ
jgi:hypothetical protein